MDNTVPKRTVLIQDVLSDSVIGNENCERSKGSFMSSEADMQLRKGDLKQAFATGQCPFCGRGGSCLKQCVSFLGICSNYIETCQ